MAAEKYDSKFHNIFFKLQFTPPRKIFQKRVDWKRPEIKTILI